MMLLAYVAIIFEEHYAYAAQNRKKCADAMHDKFIVKQRVPIK